MSTTTTTTTCAKINVFDILLSNAKDLVENDSQPNIEAAITYLLNTGIFNIPGSNTSYTYNIASYETGISLALSDTLSGTCCPDCNFYFLGNGEFIQQYATSIITDETCCLNIYSSVERYIVIDEIIKNELEFVPPTCCNGFDDCIDAIVSLYKDPCYECDNIEFAEISDILRDYGIVEYGTIGGKSILCDFLSSFLSSGIDRRQCNILNILRLINNIGLLVWCKEFCDTVLAAEDNDEILTENNETIQNCNIVWQTVGSSYDNDGFISTIEEGSIMVTMSTNGPSGAGTGFDPINLDGVEYAQCSNGLICSNYSNVSPTNQIYYIKGDAAGVVTMTFDFSPAITDPILGIWSLGSPSEQQIFKPNVPFIELSACGEDPSVVCGAGNATGLAISDTGIPFGTNTYQILGNESFGIVKFPGTHSQIQIQVPFLSEYRTNLAWGLSCATPTPTTSTTTTTAVPTTTSTTIDPNVLRIITNSIECNGAGFVDLSVSALGGTGSAYQWSWSTFTSESAALANTNWSDPFPWGATYGNAPTNETFWIALKDSITQEIVVQSYFQSC
jgi:hypothetical protein